MNFQKNILLLNNGKYSDIIIYHTYYIIEKQKQTYEEILIIQISN